MCGSEGLPELPRHMRREGKPGNLATIVQRDLHVERVLFKLRGENHRIAVKQGLAEFLDSSHLLCQPPKELARFVQRQRRAHLLVEIGLDAGVIARVDQLDELVGPFRVTIRPLSRRSLREEKHCRENREDRQKYAYGRGLPKTK